MHDRHPILVIFSLLVLAALLAAFPARVSGQTGFNPQQTPDLAYNEAQTVYLINLERRAQGLSPLRWNSQLTDAARWFAWDSTANRPPSFCDHVDTLGRYPVDRNADFSFPGWAPAENAVCNMVSPATAVSMWMGSQGHRDNLLSAEWRETGVGYYQGGGDGYVVQDFGNDQGYAPLVIENEAPATTTPQVGLYIYSQRAVSGFALTAPTVEMRVGGSACLAEAAWEPYQTEKSWSLPAGSGWRDVYVQTRDSFGRTFLAGDSIYLGGTPPLDEIGAAQMSGSEPQVTLYGLEDGPLPNVQFSLGWLADDMDGNFALLTGSGSRVNDPQALGGTAYRLGAPGGDASTSAWVWTTTFIKNTPMIAYVRAKIANNSGSQEALRFAIAGGGTSYGPLSIRANQFSAPNTYQEFALPFTFHDNPTDPFLILSFWKYGSADVTLDAVTFFTTPQPATAAMRWAVPGGSYRGQGVWVRYSGSNGQFGAYQDSPVAIGVSPSALTFLATPADPPSTQTAGVQFPCGLTGWEVVSDAPWLQAEALSGKLSASADPGGLPIGSYTAHLTVRAQDGSLDPVVVAVQLEVVQQVYHSQLPVITR